MKRLLALAALAASLSGCADFNALVSTLTSPQTTQAIANLKAGSQAIVCAVNGAAALASEIEGDVKAGKAAVTTTGQVLTASADVCVALGGTASGKATVPASAVTSVSSPSASTSAAAPTAK